MSLQLAEALSIRRLPQHAVGDGDNNHRYPGQHDVFPHRSYGRLGAGLNTQLQPRPCSREAAEGTSAGSTCSSRLNPFGLASTLVSEAACDEKCPVDLRPPAFRQGTQQSTNA